MTHSIITFGNKHFSATDNDLAATILFMKSMMGNANVPIQDGRDILVAFSAWEDSIENDGAGCINMNLENFFELDKNREVFEYVVKTSLDKLTKFETKIPSSLLNDNSSVVRIVFNDYDVERVKSVLLKLKDLMLCPVHTVPTKKWF